MHHKARIIIGIPPIKPAMVGPSIRYGLPEDNPPSINRSGKPALALSDPWHRAAGQTVDVFSVIYERKNPENMQKTHITRIPVHG